MASPSSPKVQHPLQGCIRVLMLTSLALTHALFKVCHTLTSASPVRGPVALAPQPLHWPLLSGTRCPAACQLVLHGFGALTWQTCEKALA